MEAFGKALKMQPSEVIASIRQAGLRGRGGAGFPTATDYSPQSGFTYDESYARKRPDWSYA